MIGDLNRTFFKYEKELRSKNKHFQLTDQRFNISYSQDGKYEGCYGE